MCVVKEIECRGGLRVSGAVVNWEKSISSIAVFPQAGQVFAGVTMAGRTITIQVEVVNAKERQMPQRVGFSLFEGR